MRRFLFVLILLLACGASTYPKGCGGKAASPTPIPADYIFSGESGVVTEPIELNAGQIEILFTHQGEGRFYAVLLDSADSRTPLIDSSGPLLETKTYTIPAPGLYRLDIFARDKWTLRVRQL